MGRSAPGSIAGDAATPIHRDRKFPALRLLRTFFDGLPAHLSGRDLLRGCVEQAGKCLGVGGFDSASGTKVRIDIGKHHHCPEGDERPPEGKPRHGAGQGSRRRARPGAWPCERSLARFFRSGAGRGKHSSAKGI